MSIKAKIVEIVASARSLGFPVMVYTLGSDRKIQQGHSNITECSSSKWEGKDPDLNLSASLRGMFAKSQRCIDSFSDECKSDVSEESYRRSFGGGHAAPSSNSVEPPWFRNVVQNDVGTRALATNQSYDHDDFDYPWLKHPTRCVLRL